MKRIMLYKSKLQLTDTGLWMGPWHISHKQYDNYKEIKKFIGKEMKLVLEKQNKRN